MSDTKSSTEKKGGEVGAIAGGSAGAAAALAAAEPFAIAADVALPGLGLAIRAGAAYYGGSTGSSVGRDAGERFVSGDHADEIG